LYQGEITIKRSDTNYSRIYRNESTETAKLTNPYQLLNLVLTD
jgi:hypothetical protein